MNLKINNFTSIQTLPPILQKKGSKSDTRIRILVLTNNLFKQEEFQRDLGTTYGANVTFAPNTEVITSKFLQDFLAKVITSPHYIIREECKLYDASLNIELSGLEIVEKPEKAPPYLNCTAKLRVWKPIWNKDSQLVKFDTYKYFHGVKGYIDASRQGLLKENVFGWDHLFVNAHSGLTNLDSIHLGLGKVAPRQLVISDFVISHLFYKKPQTLSYHPELKPTQAIEFTKTMSVNTFMKTNPFLSNSHLSIWGLNEIRDRILDEGVFFKAATSRPIKNYFSPPFGGIPLTAKKSQIEETVFMMHDLNHHNIPDLIFDGDDSIEMRNVYLVWRMMSEAITLVIADMLYANTLVKSNPENRDKLDSRIYPLFEALDIESPTEDNRLEIMRKLLWANTQYAVLGDKSEWEKLLKSGCEDKLAAYTGHFEKFFVGDHVWTEANFKNMSHKKEAYQSWVHTLGKKHFREAKLLLLSDMVETIKKRNVDLLSINDVVKGVFEEIFETRIIGLVEKNSKAFDDEERLSRGFRRYMTGQMSFYSHYEIYPGVHERGLALAEEIKDCSFFDAAKREKILKQYKQDVYYLWGLNIITTETADNHIQAHPIFPPVYINYTKQECRSVKEVLKKLYGENV